MKRTNTNHKSGTGLIGLALTIALGFVGIVGGTGCDEYSNLASWGGLVDPWYTSSIGLPAYPTLYDPTNDIQSVIGYSWEVMDWSNDAWSDYILQ